MYRLVLDHGHGGSMLGASHSGVHEKDLNLSLGRYIEAELKEDGKAQVMLTRDDDYDIDLDTRIQLINQHNERKKIDLVISVHHNAAPVSTGAQGFETYYFQGNQLTRSYATSIAKFVNQQGVRLRNNGVITTTQLGRRLAIIHDTTPPTILLEVGYMTHPEDLRRISDEEQMKNIAISIVSGVKGVLYKRKPRYEH